MIVCCGCFDFVVVCASGHCFRCLCFLWVTGLFPAGCLFVVFGLDAFVEWFRLLVLFAVIVCSCCDWLFVFLVLWFRVAVCY